MKRFGRTLVRLAAWSAAAAVLLLPGAVRAQAPSYSISSVNPTSIAAGAPGVTLTIAGTLPAFPSTTYGICFYTGYGSTAVIQPASASTVIVPASTIQQVPPSSFSEGDFSALVYLEKVGVTCNGTSSISTNTEQVPIVEPFVTTYTNNELQQENTATGIVPPPSLMNLQGAEFIANTTVTFAWTDGSAAGTVFLVSSSSLNAKFPAIPAGTTYVTVTLCNHTASYDYCAEPVYLYLEQLAASSGTLTVSPNPVNSGSSATLTAQFGASGSPGSSGPTGYPGTPTGTVSFTANGTTVGTAPLILDKAAGVLTQAYGTQLIYDAPAETSIKIADVNGDGIPDVVYFSNSGEVVVALGSIPFGTSDELVPSLPDANCGIPIDFELADLNGDGYPDIVFTCQVYGGPDVTEVALGLGDGTFGPATALTGAYGTQIAIADVTGDKVPDIVVAGPTNGCISTCATTYGFTVFKNDGHANFTALATLPTSGSPGTQLLLTDIDGDGLADIVELNGTGSVATTDIYLNQGAGTAFGTLNGSYYGPTSSVSYGYATGSTTYSNLFLGDFNGDGHIDLGVLSTGAYGSSVIYDFNTSTVGTAQLGDNHTLSLPGPAISVAAADFNGDHLADLAVTTNSGVTVYDSNGTAFNQDYPGLTANPEEYVAGAVPFDLNADGDADIMLVSEVDGDYYLQSYLTSGPSDATLTTPLVGSGETPLAATWPGNINFTGSTANTSVTINGLSLTVNNFVTSPNPSQYGQTVAFTLTVTSLTGPTPTGSVAFFDGTNPLGTTPLVGGTAVLNVATLSAGSHPISANYSGDSIYSPSTTIASPQVVTQATPVISWAPPASIAYGSALSATQLNATATGVAGALAGTFAYTPPAGTVLGAGANQPLLVVFTPTDTADYINTRGSTTINVTKATPTVSWASPASITYGTALSATQLDATATGLAGTLAGSFVYTPAVATVLSAGNQTLSATFTPTDITDYNIVPASTTLNVTKATPTVSWTTPASITYGTPLSATQLDATATGIAGTLAGSFVYNPAAGTVLSASSKQALIVTFTPTDTVDYNTMIGSASLTVTQAAPTITWPTPAPIVSGTPLSDTQLDATATGVAGSLAGTFVYAPAAGAVLAVGNQTLGLTFTPTDTVDYSVATASTTLSVINLNVTIATIAPTTAVLGDPAKTLTITGGGFLANSVVQVNGAALATTYVSTTSLTAVLPASDFLTAQTLYLTVLDPTQNISSAAVPFIVSAPPVQVVFSGPNSVLPAQQPTLTFTLGNPYPVPLSGTLTLTFAGTGGADDPSIQFATGGRTSTFTIAANSVITPTIQIQSGTDAGTITVTLALTAGGQDVTPAGLQPIVTVVPPVAPTITSTTLTRSGSTITVNIVGFSNTREATSALFHFAGANGASIANPDVTIDVTNLFANWFSTAGSQTYGSAFTYTQTFNLSTSQSSIGVVSVTLTNSAGTSTTATAQ